MTIAVSEFEGVYLFIEYEKESDGTILYKSIKSVDGDYKPVGQDLVPFMTCLVWTGRVPQGVSAVMAEKLLSYIGRTLK